MLLKFRVQMDEDGGTHEILVHDHNITVYMQGPEGNNLTLVYQLEDSTIQVFKTTTPWDFFLQWTDILEHDYHSNKAFNVVDMTGDAPEAREKGEDTDTLQPFADND